MTSRAEYNLLPKKCGRCDNTLSFAQRANKYCSRSCSSTAVYLRNKELTKSTISCQKCGKEIRRNNIKRHEKVCLNDLDRAKNRFISGLVYFCDFCNRNCFNIRSYATHKKQCADNPNRKSSSHPHTEETKKRLSEIRIEFLEKNPDKVPYVLNHSSKGPSIPELYFIDLFKNENKPYVYHHKLLSYEIDFADMENKIAIEIDGDQHYLDPIMVKHDLKRDSRLNDLGWTTIRVRWSEYQKLDYAGRRNLLVNLKIL